MRNAIHVSFCISQKNGSLVRVAANHLFSAKKGNMIVVQEEDGKKRYE